MKLDRFLRLAIGFSILLLFIIAIAAMLFVTEAALNVWDRLVEGPRLLLYGYVTVMVALVVAAIWLTVKLVVRRKPANPDKSPAPLSRAAIEQRLQDADEATLELWADRVLDCGALEDVFGGSS